MENLMTQCEVPILQIENEPYFDGELDQEHVDDGHNSGLNFQLLFTCLDGLVFSRGAVFFDEVVVLIIIPVICHGFV